MRPNKNHPWSINLQEAAVKWIHTVMPINS